MNTMISLLSLQGRMWVHSLLRSRLNYVSLSLSIQAVLLHPGNVKAYYRKGVALLQLQRAEESVNSLRIGLLVAPTSKQLRRCLKEAEACSRSGFQDDRAVDTSTARQVRSQQVQDRVSSWERPHLLCALCPGKPEHTRNQ